MIEETPEQGEKKMVLMNFWSNLLQLEKEIEKPSVSLQKVQELIQLYKVIFKTALKIQPVLTTAT